MRRALTLIALTVATAASLCSSAHAGQTIGSGYYSAGLACNFGGTLVQSGSPGGAYAAPYDGVITSWGTRGHIQTSVAFRVARIGSGSSYTVVATAGPELHNGGGDLESYPARIAVREGDVIGLRVPTDIHYCLRSGPGYTMGIDANEADVGDPGLFDSTSTLQVPVEATIERDRDGDGHGDDTQDLCPTDASTQGPCPPLPMTIGQTFVPFSGPSVNCATSTRVVTESPGVISFAREAGVVTSWSYQAGSDVGSGTIRVKMLRPLGASSYRVIGADQPRSPEANVLNTFPVRIPVSQGDMLGIGITGTVPCAQFNAPGEYQFVAQDIAAGSDAAFTDSTGRLDVAAVLEGDADADGFGDTTQDACPTDASTQAACPVPPPPGTDNACDKARDKLRKAKAKLRKLKQKDAAAKRIATAKKKVKKAKQAVRKSCG